ncbi:MAG: TerB family tellurite resistance protein [Gammaproteobacteria bacterium]|nr:TerB family tellurite resistance protein [Gammaproteobacteria bacterium]
MMQSILDFFNDKLNSNKEVADEDHQIKLASASLLIEMIRMDHRIEQAEHDAVKDLIKKDFSLSDSETDNLFLLAEEESRNAVDYYRFAKLINASYDNAKKIKIIDNLWHIAYADGELDKYEEHYLRKIADLLHLPHKEFIKAKHRVTASL